MKGVTVPAGARQVRRKLSPGAILCLSLLGPLTIFFVFAAFYRPDTVPAAAIFLIGIGVLGWLSIPTPLFWSETEIIGVPLRSRVRRGPLRSIAFERLTSIEPGFGANAVAKAAFMPFEFVDLVTEDVVIRVAPAQYRDAEVKALLAQVHAVRPALFPEDVLAFVASDTPL